MKRTLQNLLLSVSLLASASVANATVFTNSSAITVTDNAPASLYPSPITVSGLSGVISSVSVTINGLSHGYINDVGFILQAPNGRSLLIQSSVSDNMTPFTNYTYTISDGGASQFHANNAFSNGGTYKPTAFMAEEFDLPAPLNPAPAIPGTTYDLPGPFAGGNQTFASVFNNGTPNGVWKLFIMDFAAGDDGLISGGWSLNITTNVILANENMEFNVVNSHCQPLLNWTVNDPTSIDKFAIQRSENGSDFVNIAYLPAGKDQGYQFTDNTVLDGNFVYRIGMNLLDGELKYSESKSVSIACLQNEISLVPNPVSDIAYLEIQSSMATTYSYQIIDMMGRNVNQGKINVQHEIKKEPITLTHLPMGLYSMQVQWPNGKKQFNFVKL